MFEQPLYYTEPTPKAVDRGDLFRGYEIKPWEITPRIYKILAISAIANLLALLVVAQTSILTTKGCDSPLVGRVCEVLDTVYVASTIFGTDREYIDAAYERTDLGDYEITFIDTTGMNTEPLDYPAGYFQIANPEQFLAVNETAFEDGSGLTSGIPGIPNGIPITPGTGGSLLDTSPNIPPANPNSVEGDLPSGFGSPNHGGVPNARPIDKRPRRGGRIINPPVNPPQTTETPATVAQADPTPGPSVAPTDPVDANAYNSRPLMDLAREVNELIDQNKYRLDSPFVITARAKLDKDGKFSKGSFKLIESQTQIPDAVAKKVLLDAIAAMNDSGRLKPLSDISGKDFNLVLKQDAANLLAIIESEMESEMRANSVKASLDLAISLAKQSKSGADATQNDKDDLALLQNVLIETSGKKVTIRFGSPKELFLPMIQRKLAEQRPTPTPPSGNVTSKAEQNTAAN